MGGRGDGQGSRRTTEVNMRLAERRQEEKLSWQPTFSTGSHTAFCFLGLLPSHCICTEQKESVGRKVRRCWCRTLRDTLGCTQRPSMSEVYATCCTLCQSQLLLAARPRVCRGTAGGNRVEDLQGWPRAPSATHGRRWEGIRRQQLGCCVALGRAWVVFSPWKVDRNGWDMQPGLCSWDVLLRIEATSPCLGDVKLSLPLTPLISNVFVA